MSSQWCLSYSPNRLRCKPAWKQRIRNWLKSNFQVENRCSKMFLALTPRANSKYRFNNDVMAISFNAMSDRMPCHLRMFCSNFNALENCRWKNDLPSWFLKFKWNGICWWIFWLRLSFRTKKWNSRNELEAAAGRLQYRMLYELTVLGK